MPRVKNNVARLRRKRQLLADAKGFFGRRKNLYKTAKEAVERARRYAYRDRKNRKREFRRLWIVRINAAARQHGMSYSQLIAGLKQAEVELDRKVLADLAVHEPAAFAAVAAQARTALEARSA
jgi:large subunit ribosomal protein L20